MNRVADSIFRLQAFSIASRFCFILPIAEAEEKAKAEEKQKAALEHLQSMDPQGGIAQTAGLKSNACKSSLLEFLKTVIDINSKDSEEKDMACNLMDVTDVRSECSDKPINEAFAKFKEKDLDFDAVTESSRGYLLVLHVFFPGTSTPPAFSETRLDAESESEGSTSGSMGANTVDTDSTVHEDAVNKAVDAFLENAKDLNLTRDAISFAVKKCFNLTDKAVKDRFDEEFKKLAKEDEKKLAVTDGATDLGNEIQDGLTLAEKKGGKPVVESATDLLCNAMQKEAKKQLLHFLIDYGASDETLWLVWRRAFS